MPDVKVPLGLQILDVNLTGSVFKVVAKYMILFCKNFLRLKNVT